MRLPRVAVALAAVALLAGCTAPAPAVAPTPSPPQTPSPSHTPSVAATPTPTPDAIDLANPASWIISETGIGPIVLGDSLEHTRTLLGTAFTEQSSADCSTDSLRFFSGPDNLHFAVYVGDTKDVVQGVRVEQEGTGAAPTTIEGVGPHSTKDEVLAVYPDATVDPDFGSLSHIVGDNIWITVAPDFGYAEVVPDHAWFYELCGA